MNILGICNNVEVLKAFRIIRIVIQIIKIIVPILLIISAGLTFTKAVATGENKKAMQSVTRKIIASIIIFLVPTFIGVISKASNGEYIEVTNCIKNSTKENIEKIAVSQAKELVSVAEKSLNRSDLYNARVAVNKIENKATYDAYYQKLLAIEAKIVKKEQASMQQQTQPQDGTDGGTVTLHSGWWWPVGSSTTTVINGKTFATGAPSATRITATFGGNDSVHQGLGGGHGAIDIGASRGSNVIASNSGTVIYPTAGARIDYPEQAIKPDANGKYNCSGLVANYVVIDHGNGVRTQYSHLYKNTITVRAGDKVEQGQVIGLSGSSGCSTGPHLHFQVEVNGKRVDPLKYVSASNPRS